MYGVEGFHGYAVKEMDLGIQVKFVAALIVLYSKCGRFDYARKLFNSMPDKNIVVWNSLVCRYSRAGSLHQAIDLFSEMCKSNVKPDKFTISALLSACAQTGAFNLGNWVRKFSERNGIWMHILGPL